MSKDLIPYLISLIIISGSIIIGYQIYVYKESNVKQYVVTNDIHDILADYKYEIHFGFTDTNPVFKPSYLDLSNDERRIQDSLYSAKENEYYGERHRKINSPYKLETKYKDSVIIDYGTFTELDSIKCIRFAYMEKLKIRYDNTDRMIKESEDKKERELDLLNKSCK